MEVLLIDRAGGHGDYTCKKMALGWSCAPKSLSGITRG